MRLVTYLIVISLFLCSTHSLIAQENEQTRLENQRKALKEEIQKIKKYLEKTSKKENSLNAQVQDLLLKIKVREKLIKNIDHELEVISKDISKNSNQIGSMNKELAHLKKEYADMIYKSYKNKKNQNNLLFLLSANDFQQSYLRYQYLNQYNDYRKKQGELIQLKAKQLQQLNDSLQRKKVNKQKLLNNKKDEQTTLETEKSKQEDLAKKYKKQKQEYQAQIKQKQEEERKLTQQIEEAIRNAIVKANASKSKNTGKTTTPTATSNTEFVLAPEDKVLAGQFESNKGKLPWPVAQGIVTVRFGKQPDPLDPKLTIESSGVRIATAENQKARAIFEGTVLAIQKNPQTGILSVLIQHGNYISVYANLKNVSVSKGNKVAVKQDIGTIVTDASTGKTVLKFQIWQNTTKLNPAGWINNL